MDFRTVVDVPADGFQLSSKHSVLLMGSCFVEGIGGYLRRGGMHALVNPFGVLYNPESIRLALHALKDGGWDEHIFFHHDELWHSWMHDVTFSSPQRMECEQGVKQSLWKAAQFLRQADVLVLTWGSNRCFRWTEGGFIVANCHKVPAAQFQVETLSTQQMVEAWEQTLQQLWQLRPELKVLLTVSPYRYAKYGFHESQLGKAALLLAQDELCRRHPGKVFYFPSYEIVVDELRDYRFYKEDMLHPSEQAVSYVWERFAQHCLTAEAQLQVVACQQVCRDLAHRPLLPHSEAYARFQQAVAKRVEKVKQQFPNADTHIFELKNN